MVICFNSILRMSGSTYRWYGITYRLIMPINKDKIILNEFAEMFINVKLIPAYPSIPFVIK